MVHSCKWLPLSAQASGKVIVEQHGTDVDSSRVVAKSSFFGGKSLTSFKNLGSFDGMNPPKRGRSLPLHYLLESMSTTSKLLLMIHTHEDDAL